MPLVIVGLGVVLFCLAALLFLGSSRLYVGGGWGFFDGRNEASDVHCVDHEKLLAVIDRFLSNEELFIIWASRLNDEWTGLTLTKEAGIPTLNISFKTETEAEEMRTFKSYLEGHGYQVKEDSSNYIGAFSGRHRVTYLTFALVSSIEAISEAIEVVFGRLQPSAGNDYYVTASSLSDFGSGIKFGKRTDPLADLK